MSKAQILSLLTGIFTAWATPAWGKDIPVEIHWSGTAPNDVLLYVPGGFESLTRDAGRSLFRGTLSGPQGAPQRHTIAVRYGKYYHPFDVRIHPFVVRVVFTIDHTPQKSCTRRKVEQANVSTDSLPDAIKHAVDAGELLKIEEPNACDSNLKFGAVQAKFRQAAAMSELSNGLFLISRQIENEYKEAARTRGISVDTELAQYEARDARLEARQLLASRTNARAVGDYALALQINNYMSGRIETNMALASLYADQGITKAQLDYDEMEIQYALNPPINPHVRAGERGQK